MQQQCNAKKLWAKLLFFFFPVPRPCIRAVSIQSTGCAKACSETQYRLVNTVITLKDGNKGTGIICCHTPILINNSILDCAVSPVEIRICLKAMMAHRVWLNASQLRPIRASSMCRNMKNYSETNMFPLTCKAIYQFRLADICSWQCIRSAIILVLDEYFIVLPSLTKMPFCSQSDIFKGTVHPKIKNTYFAFYL